MSIKKQPELTALNLEHAAEHVDLEDDQRGEELGVDHNLRTIIGEFYEQAVASYKAVIKVGDIYLNENITFDDMGLNPKVLFHLPQNLPGSIRIHCRPTRSDISAQKYIEYDVYYDVPVRSIHDLKHIKLGETVTPENDIVSKEIQKISPWENNKDYFSQLEEDVKISGLRETNANGDSILAEEIVQPNSEAWQDPVQPPTESRQNIAQSSASETQPCLSNSEARKVILDPIFTRFFESQPQTDAEFYYMEFEAGAIFQSGGMVVPKLLNPDLISKLDDMKKSTKSITGSTPLVVKMLVRGFAGAVALDLETLVKRNALERKTDMFAAWFERSPKAEELNRGNLLPEEDQPKILIQAPKLAFMEAREYKIAMIMGAASEVQFTTASKEVWKEKSIKGKFIHLPGHSIPRMSGASSRYLVAIDLTAHTHLERPQVGDTFILTFNDQLEGKEDSDMLRNTISFDDSDNNDFNDLVNYFDSDNDDIPNRRKRKSASGDETTDPMWKATVVNGPANFFREGIVWVIVNRPKVAKNGAKVISTLRPFVKGNPSAMRLRCKDEDELIVTFDKQECVAFDLEAIYSIQPFKDELRTITTLFKKAEDDRAYAEFVEILLGHGDIYKLPIVDLAKDFGPVNLHQNFSTSQLAAYKGFAAMRGGLSFIHGPYGTGKSRVVLSCIIELVSNKLKHARVIYACPSNKQVDDAVLKCADLAKQYGVDIKILRVHSLKGEKVWMMAETKGKSRQNRDPKFNQIESNELAAEFKVAFHFAKVSAKYAAEKAADPRRVLSEYALSTAMVKLLNTNPKKDEDYIFLRSQLEEQGADEEEPSTILEEVKERISSIISKLQAETIKSANVIFTTMNTTSKVNLYQSFNAQWAILDEACRATELSSLMLKAFYPNAVITQLGDPMQLRPTVFSAGRERDVIPFINPFQRQLLLSFMERFHRLGFPVHFLSEQWRCRGDIDRWPSSQFYGGLVIPGTTLASDDRMKDFRQYTTKWGLKGDHSLILLNCEGARSRKEAGGNSTINEQHVEAVESKIRSLLGNTTFKGKILIISMYKAQVYKYQEILSRNNWSSRVECRTVECSQGAEQDVVFLDLVRTNGPGFTGEAHRLNVATTRARYLMVIVADTTSMLKDRSNPIDRFKDMGGVSRKNNTKHLFSLFRHLERNAAIVTVNCQYRPKAVCYICNKEGHMAITCPDAICNWCGEKGHQNTKAHRCEKPKQPKGRAELECRACGETGHKWTKCLDATICYNCEEVGHKSSDCPVPSVPVCNRCYLIGDHTTGDCRAIRGRAALFGIGQRKKAMIEQLDKEKREKEARIAEKKKLLFDRFGKLATTSGNEARTGHW